jgi:hypothetical protein
MAQRSKAPMAGRRSFLRAIVGAAAATTLPAIAAASPSTGGHTAPIVDCWARAQRDGRRLYEAQLLEHESQLHAITGGVEVDLFIAQKQREAVAALREIAGALERA